MRRFVLIPLFCLTVLTALGTSPIEIPHTIQAPGKVVPRQEWTLVHGERGQLVSTLHDHLKDTVEHFEVVDFDRGDKVSFRLHASLGSSISQGDTIGLFHSEELNRRWIQLQGQLNSELSALAMYETGRKAPEVQEANLRLAYRQTQRDWQKGEVERLKWLQNQDLVSVADFEEAENTLKLRQVNVDIAAANLQAAATGAKEQKLDWRKTRILALQEELHMLGERLDRSAISSPLAGRFSAVSSEDTLAVVCDTTAYIVLIPARWQDRGYIALLQEVEVRIEGTDQRLKGEIAQLGTRVYTINGQQFLPIKALVWDRVGLLVPGLVVHCSIRAPAPWGFIQRILTA